jgi:hypothetical protein
MVFVGLLGTQNITPRVLIFRTTGYQCSAPRFGRFMPGGEPTVPVPYDPGLAAEPAWTLWKRDKALVSAGNRTLILRSSTTTA